MLDFLRTLEHSGNTTFVSCKCAGIVGAFPEINTVAVCEMREDPTRLHIVLREECDITRRHEIVIDGVSGRKLLVAINKMDLLHHYDKLSVWGFEPGSNIQFHPSPNRGLIQIRRTACAVRVYHEGALAIGMNDFMPTHIIEVVNTSMPGVRNVAIAVNCHGAWIVVEIEPVALLVALTRCNYLRLHDIWRGKWRVHLPEGLVLSPLRSVS